MTYIKPEDLAWIAGFVDGEGYIGSPSRGVRANPLTNPIQVTITNTDPRPILFIHSLCGGYLWNTPRKGKWKTAFRLGFASKKACVFLKTILPYLRVKREQAEIAIALADMQQRRGKRGFVYEDCKEEEKGHVVELRTRLRALNKRGKED